MRRIADARAPTCSKASLYAHPAVGLSLRWLLTAHHGKLFLVRSVEHPISPLAGSAGAAPTEPRVQSLTALLRRIL